jgi:hypothetical protein
MKRSKGDSLRPFTGFLNGLINDDDLLLWHLAEIRRSALIGCITDGSKVILVACDNKEVRSAEDDIDHLSAGIRNALLQNINHPIARDGELPRFFVHGLLLPVISIEDQRSADPPE